MTPERQRQVRIHNLAAELLPVALERVSASLSLERYATERWPDLARQVGNVAAEMARAAAEKIAGLELMADIRDAQGSAK